MQDGGRIVINEMIDLNGDAIEEVGFGYVAVRTSGTFTAKNARRPRVLKGNRLEV